MSRNPFLESLDRDNDEAGVRARLAAPRGYQDSYKPLVREWLQEQDTKKAAAAKEEDSAIARSEAYAATASTAAALEANSIARRAQRFTSPTNVIAIVAIIAAVVVAVYFK